LAGDPYRIEADGPRPNLIRALAVWAGLTVVMALVPVLITAIRMADGYFLEDGPPPSLVTVAGHGEFLLVAVAVLTVALADVLPGGKVPMTGARVVLLVMAFLLIVLVGLWFSDLVAHIANDHAADIGPALTYLTAFTLVMAVVLGGCCTVAKERGI
jgi:hypothetical protein